MAIPREVQDFLPTAVTLAVVFVGFKVLSTEIPNVEGLITGKLAAASPYPTPNNTINGQPGSGLTATSPYAPTGGGAGPCTVNGYYWSQQTDGTWRGVPYCAPGQICPQNIAIRQTSPC